MLNSQDLQFCRCGSSSATLGYVSARRIVGDFTAKCYQRDSARIGDGSGRILAARRFLPDSNHSGVHGARVACRMAIEGVESAETAQYNFSSALQRILCPERAAFVESHADPGHLFRTPPNRRAESMTKAANIEKIEGGSRKAFGLGNT